MTDLHAGEPLSEHPTAEDVAAYLSDALLPGPRAALEEHLAECRQCRGQVTSARRLLRQHRSPKPLVWLAPAAVAAILVVAVLLRTPVQSPLGGEPLRGDSSVGPDAASRIGVVAPVEGAIVGTAPLVFVWRDQTGKPLFRFTLTDATGGEVWTRETGDTTVTLPASVSLAPGRTYFWTVDALGSDGRSLTTRNHRFVVRP